MPTVPDTLAGSIVTVALAALGSPSPAEFLAATLKAYCLPGDKLVMVAETAAKPVLAA
jgi:hypothetical protein